MRCLLFVPGARPERFEKALAAGPDMICIDLEDAVLPDQKNLARSNAVAFLERYQHHARRTIVRINPVESDWGSQDEIGMAPEEIGRLHADGVIQLSQPSSGHERNSREA